MSELLSQGWGDWISPALTVMEIAENGPGVELAVALAPGTSARGIAKYLKQKGVKTWALTLAGDLVLLRVKKRQARWALRLLEVAGLEACEA